MECRRPGMFWGMTDSPDTLCRSCCPTFCLPTWKGRDIHSVSNPKEFSVHSGLCNWVRCFSFSLAEPSFSCAIHQASALLSRAQTSYCSWRKCSGLQPGGPACDVRGTGQGGTEIGPSNRSFPLALTTIQPASAEPSSPPPPPESWSLETRSLLYMSSRLLSMGWAIHVWDSVQLPSHGDARKENLPLHPQHVQ